MNFSFGTLLPLCLRLWLGKLLFPSLNARRTVRVSWRRVIKGPCRPTEVEAMQYIALHTKIPIPKLFAVHIHDGGIYVEMAYIKYPTLGYVWHSLSTSQKNSVYIDLVQHTSSLRELLPPIEGVVSSAFQNPAYDSRVGSSYLGPLNHEDFHSVVRGQMPLGRTAELVGQEAVGLHTNHYRTCFTHGNLTPRNIMVKNGHVVAIIDWESAGWFPEYWEYTKAHYTALGNDDEELIQLALTKYFLELEAERILWTKLPEQGTPGLVSRSGLLFKHQGSAPSKAWLEARKTCPKKDLWAVELARYQD